MDKSSHEYKVNTAIIDRHAFLPAVRPPTIKVLMCAAYHKSALALINLSIGKKTTDFGVYFSNVLHLIHPISLTA